MGFSLLKDTILGESLFGGEDQTSPLSFRFDDVVIAGIGTDLPDRVVTTREIEEKLSPVLERFNVPIGTFEKLSGIKERRLYDPSVMPSHAGLRAARRALDQIKFDRSEIKALFNCSVTRDYFEPATAVVLHSQLDLNENALVMDITNACLGFINGIAVMGNLIQSGIIKAGLLVSGEVITKAFDHCINYILKRRDSIKRAELLELLPTLTLGCGSVAYVLAHRSLAKTSPAIVGGVAKSASKCHDLCSGNGDYYIAQIEDENYEPPVMRTNSSKLISSAAKLGRRTWKAASKMLNWTKDDVDHIFCHQVGKQVNESFYKTIDLDYHKEFKIYPRLGNLASAALPMALAIGTQEKGMKRGNKVLLMGFGSGLNALFAGIEW